MLTWDWVEQFWTRQQDIANLVIFLNIVGAMALGLLVGYERSYHGRAAGMRTYGIVCMASAALTVFVGYPTYWYGGLLDTHALGLDPTRVVQGIVTGVGFLGAGVIMKEGLNISGLTTAASIWASSAIGVLVGVGFYGAAILLALLSALLMTWGSWFEARLPSRHAISVALQFNMRAPLTEEAVRTWLLRCGYEFARGSVSIDQGLDSAEWRFVAVAVNRKVPLALSVIAEEARQMPELTNVKLAHARN